MNVVDLLVQVVDDVSKGLFVFVELTIGLDFLRFEQVGDWEVLSFIVFDVFKHFLKFIFVLLLLGLPLL